VLGNSNRTMARSNSPYDEETASPTHVSEANERTTLLSNEDNHYSHGTISPEDAMSDDSTDINPNEFDILLSRSESITTGLGIEPEPRHANTC